MNQKNEQRAFVGIKMTDEVAHECLKLQADLGNLPARFVPPKDLHLTLLPPWQMLDQHAVEERLKRALTNAKRFTLKLQRLEHGPNNMRPRLAWLACATDPALVALKKNLLHSFGIEDRVPFVPHVTIARYKKDSGPLMARSDIDRPVGFSMPVESIELFRSPHQEGAGYTVLASLPLPLDGVPH